MRSRSLVSVIIPFYNTPPRFMEEAVESVIRQTYEHWEVLLIDDGSTGASTDLAWQYAQNYPNKVRYLEHEGHRNRGIGASHQLGMSLARGAYIALLDADDLWLPHKLEQQVAILDSQPEAAMLYGNTKYWYSWTGKPEDSRRDTQPRLGVPPNALIHPPRLLQLYLDGKAAVPCTCSVLVRRDALARIGGFDQGLPGMYEDQRFYAKVCLQAPVFVSNECWDWYRQHPDSLSSIAGMTGQTQAYHLAYLHWLTAYLSQQGCGDGGVWQALNRQLWLYRQPARARPFIRWVKKWLLRLEERILPAALRRRLWLPDWVCA